VRAVDKLCKLGAHPNIVPVFRRGKFNSSDYYYLDMELCDLNLEKYLKRDWTASMREKFPFFSCEMPPEMRMSQVWEIMENIRNGVAFIHELHEIHRDLKPRNGNIQNCKLPANMSSLLPSRSDMENHRLRPYG